MHTSSLHETGQVTVWYHILKQIQTQQTQGPIDWHIICIDTTCYVLTAAICIYLINYSLIETKSFLSNAYNSEIVQMIKRHTHTHTQRDKERDTERHREREKWH